MQHIFLIGFNKCGTTSFHDFFKANNLTSVHWRANTLAMCMYTNMKRRNIPLLSGLEDWTAYSDMICIPGSPWGESNSDSHPLIEGCRYFKELEQDYPDSLFILNTRNRDDWIKSRLRHDQGRFAEAYLAAIAKDGIKTKEEMIRNWEQLWDTHHREVMEYFRGKRKDRLLVFDIDNISQLALRSFLTPHFKIIESEFPHSHRTR